MSPHNTKTEPSIGNGPGHTGAERKAVSVTKSRPLGSAKLSISEDCDQGSDPYNSTGQYVIIKSRIDLQD